MAAASWKDYRLGGERARATLLTEEVFGGHVERQWFSARIERPSGSSSGAPALKFFGL